MSRRTHVRIPVAGRALSPVGSDFVSAEVLGGVLLLGATVLALVWANFAGTSYATFWAHEVTIGSGRFAITEDLTHWINDGFMVVFFFVVGIEIKREFVGGELSDPRAAALPVIAAVGGMAVPALLYWVINAGGSGAHAWGIPMATDIAFAVVVIAALGERVPAQLKVFLLTLAIVDDIGAIVVIALFYGHGIELPWLAGAVGAVAIMLLMRRLRFGHPLWYLAPAALLWVCTLESGVHATIAGVVLGLLVPVQPSGGHDVGAPLERLLHPWSSFVVVPLFALANAGVDLSVHEIKAAFTSTIGWGIVVGLVLGKPIGIALAAAITLKLRVGVLPSGVKLRHLMGAGCVAGIGFTVSLFVADLSFEGGVLAQAKIAVLAASLVSATIGTGWLWLARPRGRAV
jgi:NhaA family Na+:H+ antiporter